ncbi:thioredoxin-like domain-containing protein [Aureivirga sp. CE67]|uniref:thioredoxin-like domain-containing protein n=1 Tax=Aureivirga sp. CE67 TaxID=1788983 RepID=UPI0018C8FED6|nr:thioredoxin-like domain-containing protein [Aureivirga sp. CE67]
MKKLILSALVISTLIACNEANFKKNEQEKGFTINVELSGVKDSTYLFLNNPNLGILDSAMVINEKFQFDGKLEKEPVGLFINTSSNETTDFILKYILIGNENVTIKSSKKDFQYTTNVKGSKYHDIENKKNQLLKDLNQEFDILITKLKNINEIDPVKIDSIYNHLMTKLNKIDSIKKVKTLQFIKNNPKTYTSINELYYLKDEISREELKKLFQNFPKDIQESENGININTILNTKLVNIGDTYVDFTAKDIEGNEITFSDLKSKKYTLIDFSTAYCGPCVQSVPELKEIAENYKDNLEIVTFSGDENEKYMKAAHKRDNFPWKTLWDGKGHNSETIIAYQVKGFPTFCLIDEEGKIVDQWFGYGKGSLKKKMNTYFK